MKKSLFIFVIAVVVLLVGNASWAIQWQNGTSVVYNPPEYRYIYAPAAISDSGIDYIWGCYNPDSGVVRDHIIYLERAAGGEIIAADIALEPGPLGSWDSVHVCDPAVVAGKFHYQGKMYSYALFYLGTDDIGGMHNQIGVAFATSLSGPWVRYPWPIVSFPPEDDPKTHWGVGQPSVTSVDGFGRVLIFYTQGDLTTRTQVRDVNLFDMGAPQIGRAVPVTNSGLTDMNGNPDYMNNADFVYDPVRDRFYAVREQRPYPADDPDYIGTALQIVSIPGGFIWSGGGRWTAEGEVRPELTGFPRNHNAGLERSIYGTLLDSAWIRVFYAVAESGPMSLWSYDLWELQGALALE
jgi:hypothetical protein